jgi:hypothetical protein
LHGIIEEGNFGVRLVILGCLGFQGFLLSAAAEEEEDDET